MVVLMILSIVVAGLSRDVSTDLKISRNVRLKSQAFNWAEAGFDVTEEMIAYALDSRGDDENNSFNLVAGGTTYTVSNTNSTLFQADGSISLSNSQRNLATSQVEYVGRSIIEGGSLIIAAGYESIGHGAGSGSAISNIYNIHVTGNSTRGNGRQRAGELYRFIRQ
jgi:Tfp pilus assembly protein PilX